MRQQAATESRAAGRPRPAAGDPPPVDESRTTRSARPTERARRLRAGATTVVGLCALLGVMAGPPAALAASSGRPAPSVTAGGSSTYTLSGNTTVVVAHGGARTAYSLILVGGNPRAGQPSSVGFLLSRTDKSGARVSQMSIDDTFEVTSGVTIASNLQSASIVTHSQLGSFGTVAMTFRRSGAPVRSCNGGFVEQHGTLSGSLTWNTHQNFFGARTPQTFRVTAMKAFITSGTDCVGIPSTAPLCPGYEGGASVDSFSASAGFSVERWAYTALAGKPVSLSAFRTESIRGLAHLATALMTINETGLPASDVAVTLGSLPSVTVRTAGAVFESGSAHFVGAVKGVPSRIGACEITEDTGTETNGPSPLSGNFDTGAMVLPAARSPFGSASFSILTKV